MRSIVFWISFGSIERITARRRGAVTLDTILPQDLSNRQRAQRRDIAPGDRVDKRARYAPRDVVYLGDHGTDIAAAAKTARYRTWAKEYQPIHDSPG
jgi:hypothetical protein